MATRGDLLDRVSDLLEDKSTTTRTRLEGWANFVLSEMKLHGILGPDATTTIATVAGTGTYNLPAALDVVDTVYLEDSGEVDTLLYVPPQEFAKHLAWDDDYQGVPEEYTLPLRPTGSVTPTIRLWPVPGAVYTVRVNYQADFSSITDDADVLELTDDNFTTAMWGLYRIFTRIEENDDIQSAFQEFRFSLGAAKMAQFGRVGRVYQVKGDIY